MQPINVHDYEALAKARMDPIGWDYYDSGSDDEVTLRENRAAFERIRLRPRVLVDVSAIDLRTTVLGTPVAMPILVAPAAFQGLAHPEGECEMARGVGDAGTLAVISTSANRSVEEVAATATGPLWFQLYVYRDREVSRALVRRAEAAGYKALVLTADAQRLGRRERDMRNGFTLPPHLSMANFVEKSISEVPDEGPGASGLALHAAATHDPSLTWEALDWLRDATALPVVVKGILTAEDATLAVRHGADAIIVSNHGGRQLDGSVTSIEALPEVVAAVQSAGGHCEIYMDGGIRRGTDILKALALGAHAVLVARPVLWGLAADGANGVRGVLGLLRDELELAMALAGRPTLASIDPSLVKLP